MSNSVRAPSRATSSQIISDETLICFSHLRWDFVFQRPQHLMKRFARERRVVYWEEPVHAAVGSAEALNVRICPKTDVTIVTPRLAEGLTEEDQEMALRRLLDAFLAREPGPVIKWYYTPMMLPFSSHIAASMTVYDCMDELANFRFAPPRLLDLEQALLDEADIVFTGGYSLYGAKRDRHPNVHPFPSSVDREHFAQARVDLPQPADQAAIPGPRLGFYGVVDERMDLELIAHIADARPAWSLIIVGPVVKIDESELPRRENIHYLGGKAYDELPAYLAGWDVALMPFAINESTRFISPTKTPEYLAGGRPVVSTAITDVERHYGDLDAVVIASDHDHFVRGCDAMLEHAGGGSHWLAPVDARLANLSWDVTFARMKGLMADGVTSAQPAMFGHGKRRSVDYLVVGAGFAGSVLAERLASQHDAKVLVVDRRPHIGGNAFDHRNDAGHLIHQYGPHIFHTNSDEIFTYLSEFTSWRPYEHRVLAHVRDRLVPVPINRTTLNSLFGLDLKTEEEAAAYLAGRAEPVETVRTSEDVVVSAVGRELYELFFQGYTRKQWGMDPSELDKSVTARIPTRTNTDDRYFADKYQCMPAAGYTAMFEKMLDHPNIEVMVGTDWQDICDEVDAGHVIFTGPVDEFFGFRFGKLPYRSLRFEHRIMEEQWVQPVGVVNYPDQSVPWTRITEYKHLTGEDGQGSSITYEYPCAEGDPYYPIPRADNQALFKRYEQLADATSGVTFVGRLATYRYYNMDQVVGQALATFRRIDQMRASDKPPVATAWNVAAE